VTDRNGGLPLLAPMSEVAGRIAVFSAAETLLKHKGGMGLLFCGVPGVAPARVLVLGGGVVGLNAARMAMAWAPRWSCWNARSLACARSTS